MENILPSYLAIGVSEDRFWDSTPYELKPYVKAQELRRNITDEELWRLGMYIESATVTAISNCFNKKSKAKYVEKPFYLLQKESVDEENLTEDQKKEGRKQLLAMLQIMQTNFDSKHVEG